MRTAIIRPGRAAIETRTLAEHATRLGITFGHVGAAAAVVSMARGHEADPAETVATIRTAAREARPVVLRQGLAEAVALVLDVELSDLEPAPERVKVIG